MRVEAVDAVESANLAATEPVMGEGSPAAEAASAAEPLPCQVCVPKPAAAKVAAAELPSTEMAAGEMTPAEVPATEVPAAEVAPAEVPAAEVHASEMAASEAAEMMEAAEMTAAETAEMTAEAAEMAGSRRNDRRRSLRSGPRRSRRSGPRRSRRSGPRQIRRNDRRQNRRSDRRHRIHRAQRQKLRSSRQASRPAQTRFRGRTRARSPLREFSPYGESWRSSPLPLRDYDTPAHTANAWTVPHVPWNFKYGLSLYKLKGIVNKMGAIYACDYEIMRRAERPRFRPRPQRPRRERRYNWWPKVCDRESDKNWRLET